MAFYGLTRKEALDLPVKTFWFMSRQIDRIKAEALRDDHQTLIAAQSADSARKFEERISRQLGCVSVEKPVYERGKMQELAKKIGALRE